MSSSRKDKRWLKSVTDPDLVSFFEDSQFDAGEYAKGFFEQREASHAPHRVEKLEGLKRQTESALRAEVVRNYQAFMHATEEIRSMEAGLQTLKDLLGSTAVTLQTFRGVHLVETVKPAEKTNASGRPNSRSAAAAAAGRGLGMDGDLEEGGGEEDGPSTSKGIKLPEWLDQAPIELEELLLERKHQEAAALIRRVREFSENVQNATNLGRGVERIFQRVETMAKGMADRLMAEISAANTLTVWGFREHKSNFALLIALGYGEKAAIFFVGERSAMIRRSLRLVEVTADPLSYVGVLSETFFGQVLDAVTAFLKLFCKSARIHERRALKTGKSTAYYQVYQGVKDCGTAPFCRLVVWVNQQIDQYAVLMGRQIRAVTMGPQRITREQSNKKSGAGVSSGEDAGFRLGPVASSLFSIVSLMLEEGFAAAAILNTMGFPVGVQLASRLVPDVTHFLSSYVDSVKDNLVEAIRKDAFVSVGCRLVRPEALCVGSAEAEEKQAKEVQLTSSARILVLELRDILDYALVLLEPPPPESEMFEEEAGNDRSPSPSGGENQAASYYTRDEFLELEPVIVTSLDKLLRTYLKETIACMRARRDELSSHQNVAVVNNLSDIGSSYVPLLAAWCAQLLPEIADEEEVSNLRDLRLEFQRSAQNPLRAREVPPSTTSNRLPSTTPGALVAGGKTTAAAAAAAAAEVGTAPGRSSKPSSSSGRSAGRPSSGAAGDGGAAAGSGGRPAGRSSSLSAGGGVGARGGTPPVAGTPPPPPPYSRNSAGGGFAPSAATAAAEALRRGSGSLPARGAGAAGALSPGASNGGGGGGDGEGGSDRRRSGRSAGGSSSLDGGGAPARSSGTAQGAGSVPRDKIPSLKQSLTNRAASSSSPSLKPPSYSASSATTTGGGAPTTTTTSTGAAAAAAARAPVTTGRISLSSSSAAPLNVSASAQADAAASRAAQAAAAASAASSGNVRSSYVSGAGSGGAGGGAAGAGAGAGSGTQRRPTLTLKAAREAAQAKAKAAAEAKAARERKAEKS